MNYYPFHVGDFLRDTAHLTDAEDLAYRRLLDRYYLDEGPISLDPKAAARVVRMPAEAVVAVLNEFFDERDDGWHHKRCDEEIMRYAMRSDSARNANRIRWQSASDPNQNQNQNQNHKPKKRGGPRKRGARLPEDWKPGEDEIRYAGDKGLDAAAVAEKFRNYWCAKSGNATKLDWTATWRNWCITEAERLPAKLSGPKIAAPASDADIAATRARLAAKNAALAKQLTNPAFRK